ncbi:MAG: FtsX-like permease family protein [Clostridia bacterium]|nr:FtsX-like permease family protein [Clostridia bacterium]
MNNNDISLSRLSLINLKRHPFRSAGLVIITAVLAFFAFGGSILSLSLDRGLESISTRLGADIMVVPLGYDKEAEGVLLRGEPSYFYFDKSVEQQLAKVEGVEQVTAQFFLTSSNQDCCALPVQFIGFDPDTDFAVQPWIKENYSGSIGKNSIIIGNDILYDGSGSLKFFDKEYSVAAVLDETGTSFDTDVYADLDTIRDMFEAAKKKGFGFTKDIDFDKSISSVLIRISDGYEIDTVVHNIRMNVDGVQIIKGQTMTSDIADELAGFRVFLTILLGVICIFSVIVMIMTFSLSVNERKREFGILRSLGAKRGMIVAVVIREALLIGAIGGAAGTALAAMIIFPFNTYISNTINLPYLLPETPFILLLLLAIIIISLIIPPVTAAYSAVKISRTETYLTMRDND